MLSYLKLKNFKCFEDQGFELRDLTIVAGANGAGKSTLIQSLMLLRQSAKDKRSTLSEMVQLNSSLVNLQNSEAVRYSCSESTDVSIIVEDDELEGSLNVTLKDAVTTNDTCVTEVSKNLSEYEKLSCLFTDDMVYLAPDRMSPEEIQSHKSTSATDGRIGDKYGSNAAFRLFEALTKDETLPIEALDRTADKRVVKNVSSWMSYIMDFDYTVVVTEQDKEHVKMSYHVSTDKFDGEISPYNMPFGNSSIFPIVVAVLTAPVGSLLVVENPEAHIHPKAQTKMGKFLALAAANGIQIIVETHSDHLLNGVRIAVKQQEIDENDVVIHFVQADEQNPLQHRSNMIQIQADGSMEDWPSGFFDEWEDSLRTLVREE